MTPYERALADLWAVWGWRPEEWVLGLSVQSENPLRHLPPETVQELADLLLMLFPHTRFLWLGKTPPAVTGRARERMQLALHLPPLFREPLLQLLDGLIATASRPTVDVPFLQLSSEEGGMGLGDPDKCPWGSWPCGGKLLPCTRPDCLHLSLSAWEEALRPWRERYQQRQFRPQRTQVEPWIWETSLSSSRREELEQLLRGHKIQWK